MNLATAFVSFRKKLLGASENVCEDSYKHINEDVDDEKTQH